MRLGSGNNDRSRNCVATDIPQTWLPLFGEHADGSAERRDVRNWRNCLPRWFNHLRWIALRLSNPVFLPEERVGRQADGRGMMACINTIPIERQALHP